MLAKLSAPLLIVIGALVIGCGDSGSGSTSNGGSGGGGASGGTTASGGTGGSTGGSGGTTASGGTGGTGGTTTSSTSSTGCGPLGDACTECLADKCGALYCACYADPACGSLVSCTQQCGGDANCNQGCFTNNQNGISEAALLSDCGAKNCAVCPGTAALGPCELCAFTSCPQQTNKCLANPDCQALVQCAQDCAPGDDTCLGICAFSYPDGQDDATALQSCVSNSCAGQGC